MDFKKALYLPSGGLSYPPYTWIKPITNEIQLFQADPNNGDSLLEYQLSIIDKYTELQVPILDLYLQDLNYLWMYFLMSEFISTGTYYIQSECKECKHKNLIAVNVNDISVTIYNRYTSRLEQEIKMQYENISITFYRRKVRHSLEFGNLLLNIDLDEESEDIELLQKIALYMATQIKSLTIDDSPVPENEYINFFLNIPYNEVFKLYLNLTKEEEAFGIESDIIYHCKKCKYKQETYLFSNIFSAIMNQVPDRKILERQEQAFSYLFSVARLPIMSYEEIIKVPLRYGDSMSKALSKIEWSTGMIM